MIRLIICFISLITLSACVSEERAYGYAVGYGKSYPEPIRVAISANTPVITQQFRHEKYLEQLTNGVKAGHWGIDVHAPIGTPVLAAAPGRVTRSYWDPGYGQTLEVTHPADASGQSSYTRYMHLHKRSVNVGDTISRGEKIGELGASGFLSGGFAHLHFEVLFRGTRYRVNAEDPNVYWADGVGKVTCYQPKHSALPNSVFKITYPVQCK